MSWTPTKTAMLVPVTIDVQAKIIFALIKVDGEFTVAKLKLVQFGTTTVVHYKIAEHSCH